MKTRRSDLSKSAATVVTTPYEFIDSNGNPAGFTIDLLRAIADVMGMKLDIRLGEWAKVHDDLLAGRIDMALGGAEIGD